MGFGDMVAVPAAVRVPVMEGSASSGEGAPMAGVVEEKRREGEHETREGGWMARKLSEVRRQDVARRNFDLFTILGHRALIIDGIYGGKAVVYMITYWSE